jgi:hypothetical protein
MKQSFKTSSETITFQQLLKGGLAFYSDIKDDYGQNI